MMRISISSFVYYNYSIEETVKRISGCGYQGIEIWGGRQHAYRNDLTEVEILQLRRHNFPLKLIQVVSCVILYFYKPSGIDLAAKQNLKKEY